ncbi:hypothetical protein DPMN_193950 [Dreissena polymorpha]|uniref:Uncharacterized protein n=1 Tax=Dreissena polymorpha TaxID=45954 RepID=A0A9D3Y1V7_DREPO|nr:hypothetical protein DPMN_193950 [Dreissena polymorpha]
MFQEEGSQEIHQHIKCTKKKRNTQAHRMYQERNKPALRMYQELLRNKPALRMYQELLRNKPALTTDVHPFSLSKAQASANVHPLLVLNVPRSSSLSQAQASANTDIHPLFLYCRMLVLNVPRSSVEYSSLSQAQASASSHWCPPIFSVLYNRNTQAQRMYQEVGSN